MGTALLSFENKPLNASLSRCVRFQGGLFTFHVDSTETGGEFALVEVEGGPGGEPPLHVHRNEDELFYLLEGKLKVFLGNQEMTLVAGESAFLPRNVPHTFKILSKYARFLVYITPGGFEGYFRDLGQSLYSAGPGEEDEEFDIEQMIRVAGRYAVTFMP
jgi:quercetin dioxygenase-like cupin family protein